MRGRWNWAEEGAESFAGEAEAELDHKEVMRQQIPNSE